MNMKAKVERDEKTSDKKGLKGIQYFQKEFIKQKKS